MSKSGTFYHLDLFFYLHYAHREMVEKEVKSLLYDKKKKFLQPKIELKEDRRKN